MQSYKPSHVRTIKASEFKVKCFKLMDEVANTGGELVITKYNRPIARLVPYRSKPPTLFGIDGDKIAILDDIITPFKTKWEVDVSDVICRGNHA